VRVKTGSVVTNQVDRSGQWHSVKVTPTPGLPKIHFYDKLNPVWWFKNRDDPVPPAWYRPNSKWRKTTWAFRNPFHNFSHYVIGIADKKFTRSGRYPEKISHPHGGWNYSVAKYKWLRLPCISYHRGKVDFYVGWRDRGNFGMKMNFNGRRTHPVEPERAITAAPSGKDVVRRTP
jgi:hypothetical protein